MDISAVLVGISSIVNLNGKVCYMKASTSRIRATVMDEVFGPMENTI